MSLWGVQLPFPWTGTAEPLSLSWQLAIAAAALACTLLLWQNQSHDLSRLPGPRGLPLLGSLLEFSSPRAHHHLIAWAKQWPVYRFRLLHNENVVITDPIEFPHLIGRSHELPKAFSLIYDQSRQVFSPTGRHSFFTTRDPAEWAAVRKACAPAFSPDNARKAFPLIRDTISEVCEGLERQAAASGEADLADATQRVALDVIGLAGFGIDFNARSYGECEVLEAVPPLLAEFSRRMVDPLRALKHRLLPFCEEAQSFSRNLGTAYALWDRLAGEVRAVDPAAAEAAGDSSLRVCLAKLKDLKTGQPLTLEQIGPHAAAFLVAGFETTAHSVGWALYEIACHPGVQSRLAAELADAGLLWAPGAPGRPLEHADLAALPYLSMVWKEALRMHPVSAFAPIRQANRMVTLQSGIRLPKGTIIWMAPCAIHSSPFNWVEPDRFWPERWEEEGPAGQGAGAALAGAGEAGEAAWRLEPKARGGPASGPGRPTPSGNSAGKLSFLPFSYGPHDCVGQALANLEGRAMLAMLCARFEFGVAQRMGMPEDVRAAEVNRLTMQPGEGVWLTLAPRAGAK